MQIEISLAAELGFDDAVAGSCFGFDLKCFGAMASDVDGRRCYHRWWISQGIELDVVGWTGLRNVHYRTRKNDEAAKLAKSNEFVDIGSDIDQFAGNTLQM